MDMIDEIIQEFFQQAPGFIISDPDVLIELGLGVIISRRTIKHIVEARKEDGYATADLNQMLIRIPETISSPDLIVPNTNQKYANSLIFAKLYVMEKQALLVVEVSDQGKARVISAYYRSQKRFEKLKAQSDRRI